MSSLFVRIVALSSLFAALSSSTFAVEFGQSVTEPRNRGMGNDAAKECIGKIESNGNYAALNSEGFMGKYQVGEAKLIDLGYAAGAAGADSSFDNKDIRWTAKARAAGVASRDDFLDNGPLQERIKDEIDQWNSGQFSGKARSLIGTSIDCSGFGGSSSTPLSMEMLIQGAQFGAGKVNSWASNGMNCVAGRGTSTNDGNGKCVTWQMCHAADCSDVIKDGGKRTCETTMPMIKAIQCSNFTGQSLSLCQRARPYLMTDGECASAEAMAKAAPKGPNAEKCENSSFGPGTGSWSYVLACSYASAAVADQDGEDNPRTDLSASDPECINKLRGMGVNFSQLGQVNNGSYGGKTCMIDNAVSLKGDAVPFAGVKLTMTCEMALAMETFGQKLKGMGVTGYYGVGSTRECGPMRDKGGNKPGTITNHAIGRAVDFSGVLVGARKVSMGKIWEPGTPDGQLAKRIKDAACSTFKGVLSPTYKGYTGAYFHNHVEMGGGNFCR